MITKLFHMPGTQLRNELLAKVASDDGSWLEAQRYESAWWKRWFLEHPNGNDDEWLDYVLGSFAIKNSDQFLGDTLIDVGGGPIGILTRLSAARRTVVDPLPLYRQDASIERIRATGEHIPLSNDVGDRVFLYNVLQHVQNPIDVLREIVRITKTDGYIYILEQLYIPTNVGHPQILTEELFSRWLCECPLHKVRWEVTRDESFAGPNRSGEAIIIVLARKKYDCRLPNGDFSSPKDIG